MIVKKAALVWKAAFLQLSHSSRYSGYTIVGDIVASAVFVDDTGAVVKADGMGDGFCSAVSTQPVNSRRALPITIKQYSIR